jgi:hypothetical protein
MITLIAAAILSCSTLIAEETTSKTYSQMSDIYHPSFDDYLLLQNFLSSDNRHLSELKDMEWRVHHFQIVEPSDRTCIKSNCLALHCTPEDRENCVLMYSSFNRNYPKALQRTLESIQASDFSGHIMYRLGGWPNTEEGDLTLAHVPYAFKVCMFREAKRMGFKRCLWLDTAVVPLVSLNTIFDMIKEKGYFVFGGTHSIQPYMNAPAAAAFGLTLEQTGSIPSCLAGILGIDFTHEVGEKIIDRWYAAARHPTAFFSATSDQNALSIILRQLNITDLISIQRLPHNEIGETPRQDSLFLLDRLYTAR